MISDIENSLLVKYLKNELNEEESQKVIGWLEQNKENQEFLFGLKDLYMLGRWEELSKKANTAHGWEKLSGSIRKQGQGKNVFRSYLKYAAILIVFFSMGYGYKTYFHQPSSMMNTIITAEGERTTVILDDGTKVKLNQNSKLVYPGTFDGKSRKVALSGEAYFEVLHDEKSPFLVDAGMYTVKVLGTKFNVEAYPGDICSYTSLKEGKVQILENETEDEHILSELRPGTQLVYNVQTGQYQLNQVDIEEIGDWMRGQIVVKHKTLQELIDILKQKYEYSFELQTDSISNIVYNIVLEQESLEEILNDITVITPQVHYSINYGTRSVIIR